MLTTGVDTITLTGNNNVVNARYRFSRLAWMAWLVYGGDAFAACEAFEQFEATRHINPASK